MERNNLIVFKINKNHFLEYWGILWFILFSGSLYFQVLRIRPTMLIIGFTIVLMAVCGWKITKVNGKLLLIYIIIMMINIAFTFMNGFDLNDFILVILRMLFCIMIQSNLSEKRFQKIFVNIMYFEAVLSLVCFLYADILAIGSLPMQHFTQGTVNGYYLTPYYTIGWKNIPVFHRNAGWFLEPGAHQIFLNFALLFLLANGSELGFSKRQYRSRVVVVLITVLTTLSTTGYMCLFVIMMAVMFMKANNNNNSEKQLIRNLRYIAVAGLLVLVAVESTTHVIEYKFDGMYTGHSSAATRYNDTLVGYMIAFREPFMGHGLFNTTMVETLKSFGVVNISNGLASFLIDAGLLLGVGYLSLIYRGMKNSFRNAGTMFYLLVFVFFLLCVNSEGGALGILLYLIYMFNWQREEKQDELYKEADSPTG